MLDPKKQAEFDQMLASTVEFFPPIWAGLYKKLVEQDLPPFVALEMVKAFIMRPSDPPRPEKPEEPKDE